MEAIDVGTPETAHDPFTLDVIKNALAAIADEMANTVARTARSFVVKEALDFSTALFNANGELIAQGTCLPLHMGAMPFAIEAARTGVRRRHAKRRRLRDETTPGTEAPTSPTWCASNPSSWPATSSATRRRSPTRRTSADGWPAATRAIRPRSTRKVFASPPVRLYDGGEPVEAIFRIIERNVRVPDVVVGDIRSQVAACAIGERQLLDLVGKYGKGPFEDYCQELLDYNRTLHALRDREAPGRELPVQGLDRRRRHRPRSDPLLMLRHRARRRPHRRFRGHLAPGAGRHQLRLPVHRFGRARLRARRPRRRHSEQRGVLPADRGEGAGALHRQRIPPVPGRGARSRGVPHRGRGHGMPRADRAGPRPRERRQRARARHQPRRLRAGRDPVRVPRVPRGIVGRRSAPRRHGRLHRDHRQLLQHTRSSCSRPSSRSSSSGTPSSRTAAAPASTAAGSPSSGTSGSSATKESSRCVPIGAGFSPMG